LGGEVIEFDFSESPLEDLTLVSIDPVRGVIPGTEVAPLTGRVAAGGPHGFKITAARVAADPDLRKFIDRSSGRYEYYLIHMAVSFSSLIRPRLKSAKVELALASIPVAPEPVTLSLDPLVAGQQVKVDNRVRIVPSVKVQEHVELSLGDYERGIAYERSEQFVRGLGLDGPRPGWEFTRTAAAEIEGAHRLAMVIQAQYGAALVITGRVTAQVRGNIPWRYGRELPNPLEFASTV
jgi:hypothetical protein